VGQPGIDESNATYWNLPAGWALAQQVGVDPRDDADLERFDRSYLGYYPYLVRYVESEDLRGKRVLEIGLGFGTLGQLLAGKGCEYHGVDIAEEPVALMRHRLRAIDGAGERIQQASALDLPFADGTFDYVYAIGCLHHTGDLARGVAEVHRVLVPGGRTLVMVYNRYSFRRFLHRLRTTLRRRPSGQELLAAYDADPDGSPPPHTDFVSRAEARRLFRDFARVRVDVQNFDAYPQLRLERRYLLPNVARVVGLDLYVTADR
jgi:SAM-dependent methyltransferase